MKLFLRSILFLVVTSFAPFASAQTPTLYYVGGPTGDFSNAADFSTSQFSVTGPRTPLLSDTVLITNNNFGFVGLGVGTIALGQTVSSTTLAGLEVSNVFFLSTNTVLNLTNTAGLSLTVSGRTGDVGTGTALYGDLVVDGGATLNYSGVGSTLLVNQGLTVVGDNIFNNNFSNISGSGTLNIQSGSVNFNPTVGNTEVDIASGTGSQGTVVQGTTTASSTVTSGNLLFIGYGGGIGAWTLTNSSVLQTGSPASAIIGLGVNTTLFTATTSTGQGGTSFGSSGTLTLSDTSSLIINSGADLQLGTLTGTAVTGGTGIIVQGAVGQTGVGPTVSLLGTSTMEVGASSASTISTYTLNAGTLNIGTNAGDTVAVKIGNVANSGGFFTQTGGTVNVGATSTFTVGGGTLGALFLNGGTFITPQANLIKAGGGLLNFGGGTLQLTNPTALATYTVPFTNASALPTGTVSTLDVSTSPGLFSVVNLGGDLTGAGGFAFKGAAGTTFNYAAGANTYTGPTSILGGTLNASAANIVGSSSLNINSVAAPATLNLNLATGGLAFPGAITGNGTLKVNFFNAAGDTFAVANASTFTGNIILGANGTSKGTLQVYSGTFGAISEGATAGSNVVIGGDLPVGIPGGFTPPTSGSVTFGDTTYTGSTLINPNFSLTATSLGGPVTNKGGLTVTTGPATVVGNALTPLNIISVNGAFTTSGVTTATTSLTTGVTGDVTGNTGTINIKGVNGNVTNDGTFTALTGIQGNVSTNTGTININTVAGNLTNNGTFNAAAGVFGTTNGTVNIKTVTGSVANIGTLGLSSASPVGTAFTIGTTLSSTGAAAVLQIRANGAQAVQADSFVAGGAVTLDPTSTIFVTGSGTISVPVAIVKGTTVTGTPVAKTPSALLFNAFLTNTGTEIDMTTVQTPLTTFATTANQSAAVGPIDRITANPGLLGNAQQQAAYATLLNAFNQLTTPDQIVAAEQSLTPASLQYAKNISFENASFMAQNLNGIMANIRTGYEGLDTSSLGIVAPGFDSSLGRSLGSLLAYNSPAYHTPAPNGVNYYPTDDTAAPAPVDASPTSDTNGRTISDSPMALRTPPTPSSLRATTQRLTEFIGGDVVLADLNQNQPSGNTSNSKASYTAGDAFAGVGFRITSNLTAGILFDYNHTDAKTDSNGSKTKVDTYSPGIFATYAERGFYANALLSYGYNSYKNTRMVPFLGTAASSSPSGQQFVSNLDLGYDFHPTHQLTIGPTLGLTYTHLDIDSFTETGANPVDLAVGSQSLDSLRSRFGGHAIYQIQAGNILLQPNLTAMWQHEYIDQNATITGTYQDFGTGAGSFAFQSTTTGKDSALLGCGLTATLDNSMSLYLNYLADVGTDDFFAQSIVGGFKASF